jgi:N-acylglucosamine-6-phosphate 2-epimerase
VSDAPVLLERLRGRLIVSVQAEAGSLLAGTETIALLARVAERNGAAAVRIEGIERIGAVRAAVAIPIIGIVKRAHDGFEPYITSRVDEVEAAARAGADIVAFDATARPHAAGATVDSLRAALRATGALAMADCSTVADARAAMEAGCDIVATTLAGYTPATRGRALPALDIVEVLAREHPFVVCEGGVASPESARAALAAGASAVVVGTAISNVDALVRAFADALR